MDLGGKAHTVAPKSCRKSEDFSSERTHPAWEYSEFNTKVTISISALIEQRVAVLGTVTRQYNHPVMGEVSLLDVLSLAGGTIV